MANYKSSDKNLSATTVLNVINIYDLFITYYITVMIIGLNNYFSTNYTEIVMNELSQKLWLA